MLDASSDAHFQVQSANAKVTHLQMISREMFREQNAVVFIKMTAILLALVGVATTGIFPILAGTLYLLALATCLYHGWRVTEAAGWMGLYNLVRMLPEADIDFSMGHGAFKPKSLRPVILAYPDWLFYAVVLGIGIISVVYGSIITGTELVR